jgi:hypothetical protein
MLLERGLVSESDEAERMHIQSARPSSSSKKNMSQEQSIEEKGDDTGETLAEYKERLWEFVKKSIKTASKGKHLPRRDEYKDGISFTRRKQLISEFLKTTVRKKCADCAACVLCRSFINAILSSPFRRWSVTIIVCAKKDTQKSWNTPSLRSNKYKKTWPAFSDRTSCWLNTLQGKKLQKCPESSLESMAITSERRKRARDIIKRNSIRTKIAMSLRDRTEDRLLRLRVRTTMKRQAVVLENKPMAKVAGLSLTVMTKLWRIMKRGWI